VRSFIEEVNKPAFREIAARFDEAIERGGWHPRSNSVINFLAQIKGQNSGDLI